MAAEAFNRGNAAFVDEQFESALAEFNAAIDGDKSNADYFAQRAAAHLKLKNFTDAVSDANSALKLDGSMHKALMRKGQALFALEEYESARAAFEQGLALAGGDNSQFKMWIRKCNAEISRESGGAASAGSAVKQAPAHAAATPVAAPAPVPTPAPAVPKVRYEWYQSKDKVVVSVFARKTKPEDTQIDFKEDHVTLRTKLPQENNEPYILELSLCDRIVPSESKLVPGGAKLEIQLRKATEGLWATLERTGDSLSVRKWDDASDTNKHSYPTSSKKRTDWSAVDAEERAKEKTEKDEDKEGDPLNRLFSQIYSGADEQTRRAMNKSFVESNGTVLSTNWKEVGSKTVKGSAPKGMEMHDWSEISSGTAPPPQRSDDDDEDRWREDTA